MTSAVGKLVSKLYLKKMQKKLSYTFCEQVFSLALLAILEAFSEVNQYYRCKIPFFRY
jgi:hypothetical protein